MVATKFDRAKTRRTPKHGQNEVWRCDTCGAMAGFKDCNRFYCPEHWDLTPYAQELLAASIRRMTEDE